MTDDDKNQIESPAGKLEKGKKAPKPRRTGQRETIVAGKKYLLRVFLGRDAAGKRHYHSETFHGGATQAEDRIREIIRRHRAGEPIKETTKKPGQTLRQHGTAGTSAGTPPQVRC